MYVVYLNDSDKVEKNVLHKEKLMEKERTKFWNSATSFQVNLY